ncbi:MAG TPA: hypothetical protein VFN71_11870 [Methylomirabilota bacterium]|nr:hypothetical protein [Methylomirabilota bacterium]
MNRDWVPGLLLTVYAVAFGVVALGGELLAGDDHPGQVYRLHHALSVGLAPWRFNPGWWAGYAELQFYPPGFTYAGALVHYTALGTLGVETAYQVLLWIAWLLPGAATYLLLRRVLGSDWLAVSGAFLALVLSAGSRSGVEEGLRWGLVASRFAWGLLPLLGLSLLRWVEGRAPTAWGAAPLLAAVILSHPAHAPAGMVLIGCAAWLGTGPRAPRVRHAALVLLAGGGLAAFWLVPLLAHLRMALPLAWGEASLGGLALALARQPLLLLLGAGSGWAAWLRRSRRSPAAERWLLALAPVLAVVVALDAVAAPALGLMWLPADRLMDSLMLTLVLGGTLALAEAHRRLQRLPASALAVGALALAALLPAGGEEPTLTLWPQRGQWPRYEAISRGLTLDTLWHALGASPPGRVLYIRSAVPLEYRPEWWRFHTHVTALTPLHAGREIINGTFTHPSPVAGLVYSGSADNRPITLLVEQRDGVTLLGRPLEHIAPDEFNRLAEALRVSVVVALEEDLPRLGFLSDDKAWAPPASLGPFRLFYALEPRFLPTRTGPQRWRLPVSPSPPGWMTTGLAYSPLWRATAGAIPLELRKNDMGLLEVNVLAGTPDQVVLEHTPGGAEWTGLAMSAASALALSLARIRSRRPRC